MTLPRLDNAVDIQSFIDLLSCQPIHVRGRKAEAVIERIDTLRELQQLGDEAELLKMQASQIRAEWKEWQTRYQGR